MRFLRPIEYSQLFLGANDDEKQKNPPVFLPEISMKSDWHQNYSFRVQTAC